MSQKYVKAGTEGQFEDEVMERHRSGGSLMSRSDDERYFRQVKTKPVRLYTPPINPERLWNPSMNAMEYVEEGTHGQFEDEVMERHRSGGTFSSEEVSSMTSDQFVEVMRSAGQMQTGLPESFALSGQGKHGRKLGNENWINDKYGSALENVGDVYHRMTAAPEYPMDESEVWGADTLGKTTQAVRHLEPLTKGFEVIESWFGGYHERKQAVKWTPTDEEREWGKGYSEAHSQLPVYTPVQQLANQSAIHLGKHQFGPSMEALGTMRNMEIAHNEAQPEPEVEVKVDPDTGEEAEWTTYHTNPDTEYNRGMSQPASVEFLRSQGR
ncbi:MAG: hypothetical protein QGH15_21600 [Kiritimatiellia bacterium]|jgi:membrane peptidoglycan carboxypeptidase|nr:hypothetical protein [Kiritimatiellia bacterium]